MWKSDVIWCWKGQQSDVDKTDPSGNTESSANEWIESSSLHDTRTAWLLCSESVILANKLSLQELNQIIGIKLLATGFLEILGS